jgi:hypothetical protein
MESESHATNRLCGVVLEHKNDCFPILEATCGCCAVYFVSNPYD